MLLGSFTQKKNVIGIFFLFDGQGARARLITYTSTNFFSDLVKGKLSTLGLGDSNEIYFLMFDPKNLTLINCIWRKLTNQPD